MTAPVPRPPQPTRATWMVFSSPAKTCGRVIPANVDATATPPVVFSMSRRDMPLFRLVPTLYSRDCGVGLESIRTIFRGTRWRGGVNQQVEKRWRRGGPAGINPGLVGTLVSLLVAEKSGFQPTETGEQKEMKELADRITREAMEAMKK